jgi:hypothetical protein
MTTDQQEEIVVTTTQQQQVVGTLLLQRMEQVDKNVMLEVLTKHPVPAVQKKRRDSRSR